MMKKADGIGLLKDVNHIPTDFPKRLSYTNNLDPIENSRNETVRTREEASLMPNIVI